MADPLNPASGPMDWAARRYQEWIDGNRRATVPPAPVWPEDNPIGTQTTQQMSAAVPLSSEIAPGSMSTTGAMRGNPLAIMLAPNGQWTPQGREMVDRATTDALSFGPSAIRAYHGSPHKFDRFDPKYIGTGEGAQAYGRGLYFAGEEGIARGYRDKLSPQPLDHLNDILINFKPYYQGGVELTPQSLTAALSKSGNRHLIDASSDPAVIKDVIAMVRGHDIVSGTHSGDAMRAASRLDTRFGKLPPSGHMYEVNLKTDPHRLLDWDKPLSQQGAVGETANAFGRANPWTIRPVEGSKAVQILSPDGSVFGNPGGAGGRGSGGFTQKQAQKIIDDMNARQTGMERTGEDLYRSLYRVLGKPQDPAAPTEALRGAGIPGIQYLNGVSRSAGQGGHNYVMFDPDLIEIVRRYGVAGLLSGAGLASQGNPEQ